MKDGFGFRFTIIPSKLVASSSWCVFYDTVAYAGNFSGDEMKEFVAAFTTLALEAGWPLVIDERTAVPVAEYLGWSDRFKQTGSGRSQVM
jgi:hypothetical protein